MNIILIVIIGVYGLITPLIVIQSIRFGIKISSDPEKAEEPVFHLPKKKKEPKMTAEEQRTMQILANIDRYDGSEYGQKPIKRENS